VSKGLTPFRRRLADRIPSGWLPVPARYRIGTSAGDPELLLRKPLDSSIRWTPDGYVDHAHTAEQPFDLFVDHFVLRDVMAHLLGARADGSFGLLSGKLHTCSSSEMPYVRIRNAHPAEQPLPETADMGPFRQHLEEVAEQAESEDQEVLGWYHPHNLLGVTLTARDSRLHMEHFNQPWHCALVIVPERRRPRGGFFTRLRGDVAFRSSAVPFFEVVPASELGDQPAPSYVGWPNYEAHRPFTRLLPDKPSAARPGGTRRVRPEPDAELPALDAELPAPVEAAKTEVESLEAPESDGAGADPQPAVEPAVEEGQTGPAFDPLLKKRLEALRYIRAFGEPPDHSAADAVAREVADQDAMADAVAAREFLWQRWGRRSARFDSAE